MKRFRFYFFYILVFIFSTICFNCVFTSSGKDNFISVTVCNKTNENIELFSYPNSLVFGVEIKPKSCQTYSAVKGDSVEARGCATNNNYGIHVFQNSGETWFICD